MTITQSSSRLVAVAAGVAVALVLMLGATMPVRAAALSQTQIQSILGMLTAFGADQATINNVSAALNGQATPGTGGSTGGTTTTGGVCPFTWSRTLQVGSTGADVKALQQFLNMNASTMVAASGAGSPGMETTSFGPATKAAVMKFQTANGISALGLVGPSTRAKLNSLCTGSTGGNTGGNTGGTTTSGTGLKVMLAATSPMNSVLVTGQAIGDIGEFAFTNPSSAPITVTGLTFNRIGVSNDQTINNVYLYNGVVRLTDSAGISNSQFSFTNAAGLFTVQPGATYVVAVRADIASGTSGQQLGVSLTNVAASGSLNSATTFPINSGFQMISQATLATVDFSNTTLPADTSVSPQAGYVLWQNNVSVSTNPVWLKSMRFTNLGSIDASAVTNLALYVDGTQVGSTVASLSADRSITFDLSANPLKLSTQSHVIKVLGDIVGGANRTIQLSLQRSSDAMFVDSQLNQPLLPTKNATTFGAVNAGTITVNSVSGSSGISATKSPSSPVNDVSVGATNVKWASFDMLSSGEATKVMDLYVIADTSVHNGGLKNGKVFINGVQVGSTKDIAEGTSGSSYTGATDFSLGSSMILPAGQTVHVDIYADAKTSTSTNLSNNETAIIYLIAGSSNAQGQSSLNSANVPSANVGANSVSIVSSALTATKYTGYSNQTLIAGTSGAKIGAFTLAAGATEGLNVNTIALSLSSNTGITNLTLKDENGVTIGTPITSPAASTNTFSVNLNLAASQTKTINVFADLLSNATSATTTLKTSTSATGAQSGITASVASDVNLQIITIGSGALFGQNGSSNPVAKNVVGGGTALPLGNYTFQANNSAYTVTKLLVKVPNGVVSAVNNVTLSYKDASGVSQSVTQALTLNTPATDPYATATFTGLSFYVPQNSSADLNVSASIAAADSQNGISGNAVKAYIDRVNGFQALDSSGYATTSAFAASDLNSNSTSGYGLLVVRKSVPTFAAQTVSQSSSPTSGTDLFRFTITADAGGDIEVYKLSFTVSTTTVSINNFALYDVADTSTALNTATSTNNGTLGITPTQVIKVGAGQTKTFVIRASSISGWGTGASVSVRFANVDASAIANGTALAAASNSYVWSDRSAVNHSTTSSDWTNGYLLKNLTDGSYSYNY